MTAKKSSRQIALTRARQACFMLVPFVEGQSGMAILTDRHREHFADLVDQFCRLDTAERNRTAKAGRKRDANPSRAALAMRRSRARKSGAKTDQSG